MNVGKLSLVSDQVKTRRYDSTGRRHAAQATRSAILDAARELFVNQGYAATSMVQIATHAGVAPDTVYASVGKKAELFTLLIESALSGQAEAVPGEQREYVTRMRAATTAQTKLGVYASAVTSIQARLAPLFLALRAAAQSSPELVGIWTTISERRAANMRRLVDDLATTGELRADLTHDEIADVIWTMNSSEFYALLVLERRWTPQRFETWLRDAWVRLLTSG
jgi:AcrR family transcriptional regulator